jgi:protein ImuB
LLWRLDQALGTAEELLLPFRPAPTFQAARVLEYPLTKQTQIEQVVAGLLQEITQQLRRAGLGALRLVCRFDVVDHPPQQWQLGLYEASARPEHLLHLLRLPLERTPWRGAVGRIGLSVEQTAPLPQQQRLLFEEPGGNVAREAAQLVERLSGRLGEARVLRPRLLRDPLPERQVKLVPALAAAWRGKRNSPQHRSGQHRSPQHRSTPARTTTTSTSPASALTSTATPPVATPIAATIPHALQRPLRLFKVPAAIEVVALAPMGTPVQFHYAGRWQQVMHCEGPERIETGWWRGATIRRDYYRVETPSGGRYWLFRSLRGGNWFLHGQFS